jgi:hypothetical protein
MDMNTKHAERVAIAATLDPASVAASTVLTSWVSMAAFHQMAAIVQTGVMGAGGTIDAKLRQATDSSGTGAKDITGKAITQIVKASGDNKQVIIECRDTDLDTNNGFAFVALSVTVGTAASLLSAQLLGCLPLFAPASASNQAGVVQTV